MHWKCPYCEKLATVIDANIDISEHAFNISKKDTRALETTVIRCPNDETCGEYTLESRLYYSIVVGGRHHADKRRPLLSCWKLRPASSAATFPDYIPLAIRNDYNEACLIVNLSPKASATLSRRCLQGMIRDFHNVSAKNLYLEIQAIKDKIDVTTWEAIDAVRRIGNIGAHMESDIDLIVDVDPGEAALLIGLIETLIDEWYVHRFERALRMSKIVAVAAEKKAEKDSKVNESVEPKQETAV